MKHIILTISLLICAPSFGQSVQNINNQSPVIYVTGTAEKEIIPDEIYITIRLEEYTGSKKKNDLIQLDQKLRKALLDQGFNPQNLYLSDAKSNRIHLKRKSIIQALQYTLMVSSAKEAEQVFNILNTLKIRKAYIAKTSHSNIEHFRKEVRIEAIKAAKDKANYTLEAVGESCGKPIEIRELDHQYQPVFSNIEIKQNVSTDKTISLPDIKFEKIKITTTFNVQFKIK